jgi:UDP-glucose 4-epimerase
MLNNPVDEKHPEFPMDIYSANKTACEKYFLIYGSYYRMRTTVVRLANVYGPRSSVRSPDFGFMNYFIGLALQGKEVTVYGDGAQLRNVSYVDDCVGALMLAATNSASEGQVLFATADRQYSVAQIAQAIVHAIGGSLRTIEWPKERAAIEIGDAVISNSKIKNLLGWLPRTNLESGLRLTGDYFRPVLHKYI